MNDDRSSPLHNEGAHDDSEVMESRLGELLWEYVDRWNAGEPLDYAAIQAEHPDVGADLVSSLQALQACGDPEGSGEPTLGTLGDYTLLRQIGRGGMGVVYEAWENSMDRRVALKVLPATVATDEKAVSRFIREAQAAGRLNHPNVVPVHGMGIKERSPYYAMEYVDGETLSQVLGARIRRHDGTGQGEGTARPIFGTTPEQQDYYIHLAEAFADVADGLQHAHSKGVIHRDIKPSNLILDSGGRLRILDFGLARLEGQESLTFAGDFVGTPAYMSPEQAKRRKIPVDHRTDIYSLGATLYELLAHERPFRGKDHQDTLSRIIERDPRPPRQLHPAIPVDLETITLKCLEKEPGERYLTAEALGQDLRRFARAKPIEARPRPPWEQWARRVWRHRVSFAALAAALLVGLLGLVGGIVLAMSALGETRTQRDAVTRQLYISDIRLARSEWDAGNVGHTRELLLRHVPADGAADLRGWEWYRLRGLLEQNVRTLEGHEAGVGSLSWSPDGARLASASVDGTLRIWDPETAETLSVWEHGHEVRAVHWSPEGEHVASGDADGRLRIWNVADGRELAAFEGNGAMVACVRWSPDATLLAVSDCDGNLDVREPWTGNVVLKTSVADQPLWSLAWSPDGRTLAGGANMNQRITLWSMPTGEVLRSWKVGSGYINGLAWSPDGERLASVAGTLKVWDPATGTRLWKLYAYARAVDWRGGWIATGGVDGLVRIWNVGESGEATEPTNEEVLTAENSRPLLTLRGHAARVRAVAWRPDGEALASSGSDGTIKVWHPVVDQTTRVLEGSQLATWSPDGKWVASRHRELVIYDSESDAPPRTIFPRGEDGKGTVAKSAAWSPDGSRLAVARKPGRVSMLAWPSAETLYTIEAHGQVRDPDHEHVTRARSLAWSPDGRFLVTGGFDRLVKVWDAQSGELLRQLEGHDDTVGTVVWSPDGTRIASATWTQEVRIWDAATGEVIHALRRHPYRSWGSDSQYSLAWSPGSERLASGGAEGALIIWDAASGEELLRRPAHIGNLQSVSWSADGRRLATWGIDGWVKVLDAGTADELARFAVPRQHGSVAWSPDGMRLAASGAGLRVWDASPGYDLTTDEEE